MTFGDRVKAVVGTFGVELFWFLIDRLFLDATLLKLWFLDTFLVVLCFLVWTVNACLGIFLFLYLLDWIVCFWCSCLGLLFSAFLLFSCMLTHCDLFNLLGNKHSGPFVFGRPWQQLVWLNERLTWDDMQHFLVSGQCLDVSSMIYE